MNIQLIEHYKNKIFKQLVEYREIQVGVEDKYAVPPPTQRSTSQPTLTRTPNTSGARNVPPATSRGKISRAFSGLDRVLTIAANTI